MDDGIFQAKIKCYFYKNNTQLKRFFYIIFWLLILSCTGVAQRITGTWQGEMEGNEYLQINIVEVGDKLCGYTWDYDLNDTTSFCKAYFNGGYDKMMDAWYLEGYSFMKNNGGHYLMQIKFKIIKNGKKILMKGMCRIKPTLFFSGDTPSSFTLEKVSSRPTIITQTMKDCIAEFEPPKKKPAKKTAVPKKEIPTKKTLIITDSNKIPLQKVEKIKDTVAIKKPVLTVTTLPKQTNGRANKELRRIIINDKKITLNIYDNGTIDGDTVSIYYNGKQIVKSKRLTANALVVDVTLDENTTMHSIVLYAENLGSIPPNTALVVFTTAAGKRYELFSSATLQQNAEIVFEYNDK